jgi:ethanolamine permease
MLLNIVGVQIAATFEVIVTILAIAELLVFMMVVSPGSHVHNFLSHGWGGSDRLSPHLIGGMFAAVPFAIWFFLAIEGVAMAAEEVRDPKRSIPVAYLSGIGTLLLLAFGVMYFAGSVGDWRMLANINDPLPQAMKLIVGTRSGWLHMLVWLGLFGLIASFHGIILGYSRQIFALARAGFLPRFLAAIHPRFDTPWVAILAGGIVGIAAIFSDNVIHLGGQPLTANIVTVSALGALLMYIVSMVSLIRLRQREPNLPRPFRAIGYPYTPAWTLFCASIALGSLVYYNRLVSLLFVLLLAIGYILYRLRCRLVLGAEPEATVGEVR